MCISWVTLSAEFIMHNFIVHFTPYLVHWFMLRLFGSMIALHIFSGDLVIDIELFFDYHSYAKCYIYSDSYIFILFTKMSL